MKKNCRTKFKNLILKNFFEIKGNVKYLKVDKDVDRNDEKLIFGTLNRTLFILRIVYKNSQNLI